MTDNHQLQPKVCVLLSTFNGEKYLQEMIDSIINQREVDVRIVIADDGSTDGTISILKKYCARYPNIDYSCNARNMGPGMSFMNLLYAQEQDNAEYFAFADQDDVWDRDKLRVAIGEMKKNEPDLPTLYFSEINNFGMVNKGQRHEIYRFKKVSKYRQLPLFDNWAYGCTMVLNRELVALVCSKRVSDITRPHDAWIHLIANYCGGKIIFDCDHALINRRIHSSNTIGIAEYKLKDLSESIIKIGTRSSHPVSRMAALLLEEYGSLIEAQDYKLIESVANYRESVISRMQLLFSMNVRQPTLLKEIKMRAKILLGRY